MSDYGFWNLAQKNPSRVALVEPDGRSVTAGELLAAANRLVHGLRALGLQQGDCVATVLPNGAPMIELYLAAGAGRAVPDADQSPPDRAGDRATSCRTPRPRCSSATSASPTRAAAPPRRPASRRRARFAVGARRRLPRRTRSSRAGQPDDAARRSRRRAGDELHLGHHRPPEGRAPAAGAVRSRHGRSRCSPCSSACSASSRENDNVHLTRLAALPHRRADVHRLARCTSATPSC